MIFKDPFQLKLFYDYSYLHFFIFFFHSPSFSIFSVSVCPISYVYFFFIIVVTAISSLLSIVLFEIWKCLCYFHGLSLPSSLPLKKQTCKNLFTFLIVKKCIPSPHTDTFSFTEIMMPFFNLPLSLLFSFVAPRHLVSHPL